MAQVYKLVITETLQRVVHALADDDDSAKELVDELYSDQHIILSSEDFVSSEIDTTVDKVGQSPAMDLPKEFVQGDVSKAVLAGILSQRSTEQEKTGNANGVGEPLFGYHQEGKVWVAFDYRGWNCWVEEFKHPQLAINWLFEDE